MPRYSPPARIYSSFPEDDDERGLDYFLDILPAITRSLYAIEWTRFTRFAQY